MDPKPEKRGSPYAQDKMFYKNFEGGYVSVEYFWQDHQQWLEKQGYMLRPRYHPDWRPSWEGTKKYYENCEDGLIPMRLEVIDATRVANDRVVVLKKSPLDKSKVFLVMPYLMRYHDVRFWDCGRSC